MSSPPHRQQRSSGPNRSLPVSAAPTLTEAELQAEAEAEAAEVQRLLSRGFTSAALVRSAVERTRWRRRRSSEEVPVDPELWGSLRYFCSMRLGRDVIGEDPDDPPVPLLAHAIAAGFIAAGSEAARLCEQQDRLDQAAREAGGLRQELDQARQRAEEAERLAAAADAARREQEAQQSQEARRQQEARREAAARAGEMAELRRERDRAVARARNVEESAARDRARAREPAPASRRAPRQEAPAAAHGGEGLGAQRRHWWRRQRRRQS